MPRGEYHRMAREATMIIGAVPDPRATAPKLHQPRATVELKPGAALGDVSH